MVNRSIERRSLCKVINSEYNDEIRLLRLADIFEGQIDSYSVNEDERKVFDNRELLYWNNGPDTNGFIGVWDWTAVPNRTDSEKDFVQTAYIPDIDLIEIIEVSGVKTLGELIIRLQQGVIATLTSRKVLFSCLMGQDVYLGVLCEVKDIEFRGDKAVLKENIISLPQYTFYSHEIFCTKVRMFYKFLDMGEAQQRIMLKTSSEIVREAILRRSSWQIMKLYGVSRNQWKQVKAFLTEISDESLYQEIAKDCDCSEEKAKVYVESFISNINNHINQEDIDSNIIKTIIENHEGLMKRCETIVAEQWKSMHKQEILVANSKLKDVNEKVAQKKAEFNQLTTKIDVAQQKLEDLVFEISKSQKLGEEIDAKVTSRIHYARKNVADFISELAFSQPALGCGQLVQSKEIVFRSGLKLNQDELEMNKNWREVIGTLESELLEAGIANIYLSSFAAFVYASYINHAPLLLAGPCGLSIANAFSVTLFGKTAGVLDCSCNYSALELKNMLESDDSVIVIKNPFHTTWLEHIPELLVSQKKYYIMVCPFAEDLVIEPRGLYNYIMPVLTEVFVDKMPTNDFVGGYMTCDFEDYEREKVTSVHGRLLRKMNMGRLGVERLQYILSDVHVFLEDSNAEIDYLFGLFPYAYAVGQARILIEKLRQEKPISSNLSTYILTYLGEDE